MELADLNAEAQGWLRDLLGYLNFSSGAPDVQFRRNTNEVFALIEGSASSSEPACRVLAELLRQSIESLRGSCEAFTQLDQAAGVASRVFDDVLPAYRQFHRDLLFHHNETTLFRPFFVARVAEAVLSQGPPWNESARIVAGALSELNQFIGHRPVAVLRSSQKIEPHAHECVAPIPVYFAGTGVAVGRYRELIEKALEILGTTAPDILTEASFDLDRLDELALDPRAYDFDHPANKRPNYQFGQWDPHVVDNRGYYRRFVLQAVTVECIWQRVEEDRSLPRDELLTEAGAVLAGTMLMASGTSGHGPDAHSSEVTLGKLMPTIASYRDRFYEYLLGTFAEPHAVRLREEAQSLHQPFGAARQALNQRLARLRAMQLQRVHLAQLYARMGYAEASRRQAQVVPVTSARMLCEIEGRVTAGHHAIERGELATAARLLPDAIDLLHRAVECGALIDPWNILGFQGQFSLFPALENSVRDHRVDVLIHVMGRLFGLAARLEAATAAQGENDLRMATADALEQLSGWWDQFATGEVSGIESVSGAAAAESACYVASALEAQHHADSAAGDVAFWRQHVDRFRSPKAYALVTETLLDRGEFVASMALLMQWLNEAEQVGLTAGDDSFHALALRWLNHLLDDDVGAPCEERWSLAQKFFDYLEANAQDYCRVPRWNLSGGETGDAANSDVPAGHENAADEDEEVEESLFDAAYEGVIYRDSTDDGIDGDMVDGGYSPTEFELDQESRRMEGRLRLLITVARLWKIAAVAAATRRGAASTAFDEAHLADWLAQARANRRRLLELLEAVGRYPIPKPNTAHDSLVEYDRRRRAKESLLARIIVACVEMTDAARHVAAAMTGDEGLSEFEEFERQAVAVMRAMVRGDAAAVRETFAELRITLGEQPILYVPLARDGAPERIVAAHGVKRVVELLLRGLARLGLLTETYQLILTAQAMERKRPEGEGAVTEFDRLFATGYQALVDAMISACGASGGPAGESELDSKGGELAERDDDSGDTRDADLVECLEMMTEPLLKRWLEHSRTLRLSVLEKIDNEARWQALREFIERYGKDLFTPRFINLGNLRAILQQGVDVYLRNVERDCDEDSPAYRLARDLENGATSHDATAHLALIVEALIENYLEFKDYNSTTTQSDHGELLYLLLDFLRLKVSYERQVWHIQPVAMAHEVLVRRRRLAAAEAWRTALAQRMSDVADWHIQRLRELSQRSGIRLPTINDLLDQRFVRPLAIDQMKALIAPAIDARRRSTDPDAFAALEQEIEAFAETPTGSGHDVPSWLVALENEVDRIEESYHVGLSFAEPPSLAAAVSLTPAEVRQQLEGWNALGT